MVDHLLFPPTEELYIFAGDDAESCSDEVFTPNSCVLFPKEILWSTSGDGTFDDPTLETPGYSFGTNDIANGQVVLSLTATDVNDVQQNDDITITVNEGLSDLTPEMPVGETLIDTRVVTQSVYQAEMETTADFIWALEPEEAGTMSTEGHQATVSWNSNFRGTAHISYRLSNECSMSGSSEALAISVVNSTSIDESNTTSLEVFPNPASERIELRASNMEGGTVVIRIIDAMGRIVYSAQKGVNAGAFNETLNTAAYCNGLYDLQVIEGTHIHSTSIIIKK